MGEGKLPLDWGMGETLAYATLLNDGYGVRISGQDVGRGTFAASARRAARPEPREVGFRNVDSARAREGRPADVRGHRFRADRERGARRSSTATRRPDPERLVIWEAQFGDFANGAQVVIDQFIASGEAKWGRICSLVMLLPHGYEGQGPEHSSARPERYLQLCAEHNMQVCVPSTPAQIYHLLRRQMLRRCRRPLIVMSPKSLLRHKDAVSTLDELADGRFQNVIGEVEALTAKNVKRVIACSGKIYYELVAHRREHKIRDVAIIRVEQQYPFPHAEFTRGARAVSAGEGSGLVPGRAAEPGRVVPAARLSTAPTRCRSRSSRTPGRPVSASTAVGYMSKHLAAAEAADRGRVRGRALTMGEDARRDARSIRQSVNWNVMRVEVKVPQLPESVAEATLVSWHKKVGEAVARDENLVDVETDKVVLELPAPQAGVLGRDPAGRRRDRGGPGGHRRHRQRRRAVASPAATSPAQSRRPPPRIACRSRLAGRARRQPPPLRPAALSCCAQDDGGPRRESGRRRRHRPRRPDHEGRRDRGATPHRQPRAPARAAAPPHRRAVARTARAGRAPTVGCALQSRRSRPEQRVPMSRLRQRVAERARAVAVDRRDPRRRSTKSTCSR